MITIQSADSVIDDCESVIIVPELAIEEAGCIRTLTAKNNAHSKHEFYAMAQTAYIQFQDGELEVDEIDFLLIISLEDEIVNLSAGMVLYRDLGGKFHVLVHRLQNKRKLLETAHRYCTRWVRLDI